MGTKTDYTEYMNQRVAENVKAGMSMSEAAKDAELSWANKDLSSQLSSVNEVVGGALKSTGSAVQTAQGILNKTNTQYNGFTGTHVQEFDNDSSTSTPSYTQWRSDMENSESQLKNSIVSIENTLRESGNNISERERQEMESMLSKLQDTKADLVATQSAVDAALADVENADAAVNGMILDFDAEGLRVSAYTYMSSNNAGGFTTDKYEGDGEGSKGVNIFGQSYQKHGFGEGNEYDTKGVSTMTDIKMAVDTDKLNELRRNNNGGTTGCLDDAFTILSQLTGKEHKASYDGGDCEKCTFDFMVVKEQLDDGKPVIIHVGGPLKTHWVAVTGYKGACSSLADLIAIDNWGTNSSGGGEYDGGYWDEKGDYHAGKSELVLGADALSAKKANKWCVYNDMYVYNP